MMAYERAMFLIESNVFQIDGSQHKRVVRIVQLTFKLKKFRWFSLTVHFANDTNKWLMIHKCFW